LFVSLGGWLGHTMGRDAAAQSRGQRESVTRFWRILSVCLVVFVLLPLVLWAPLGWLFGSKENHTAAMRRCLDVLYVAMVAALGLWAWQRRKSRSGEPTGPEVTKRTVLRWPIVLAMVVAGGFLALGLSDTNWKVDRASTEEARKLILEKGKDAEFSVLQFQNGTGQLWIKLRENGNLSKFIAPADPSTLSLLAEKGIQCPTYVQGRDFEILGWEGKLLMGLCLLILAAGAGVFLTLLVRNRSRIAHA